MRTTCILTTLEDTVWIFNWKWLIHESTKRTSMWNHYFASLKTAMQNLKNQTSLKMWSVIQ